jgi:hypothetical protein
VKACQDSWVRSPQDPSVGKVLMHLCVRKPMYTCVYTVHIILSYCKDTVRKIRNKYSHRKGTAGLQSQSLHSCFCERFIYIPLIGLPILLQEIRWKYRLQTHECGNWAEAAQFLFWDDRNSNFFPVQDIGNYYFLAAEVPLAPRKTALWPKLLTFADFLLNFYVIFFSLNFLDFVKHNVHGIPGFKDL